MKKVKVNFCIEVDGKQSSVLIEFNPIISGEYQGKYEEKITVKVDKFENTTKLPPADRSRLVEQLVRLANNSPDIMVNKIKKLFLFLGVTI